MSIGPIVGSSSSFAPLGQTSWSLAPVAAPPPILSAV